MIDLHRSIVAAVAAERRQQVALRDEMLREFQHELAELKREMQAGFERLQEELREAQGELALLRGLRRRDAQTPADISRTRAITAALLAERDPNAPLQ